MKAGQKSIGANGKQNIMFPLPSLYVSNIEHEGHPRAVDFVGWSKSGRVYKQKYYAPVDCKCIYKVGDSGLLWQSIDLVNFIDGSVDYLTFATAHSDDWASVPLNTIYKQGDYIGSTGTSEPLGAFADHLHLEVAKGLHNNFSGMRNNAQFVYNVMGVNDTDIYNSYGFTWREFSVSKDKDLMPLFISGVI